MSQCPIKIHEGQQGKHIVGHPHYERGRSILWADPADLLPYAGTGRPIGKVARGEPGFKECVNFGRIIGLCVDDETNTAEPTTNGIFHYGKLGLHIVPSNP